MKNKGGEFILKCSRELVDVSPGIYLDFKEKYGKGFSFEQPLQEWGFSKEDAITLNEHINNLDNE